MCIRDRTAYAEKSAEKDIVDKELKEARNALDDKVEAKYSELSIEEIKHLLFDLKWMAKLETDICGCLLYTSCTSARMKIRVFL